MALNCDQGLAIIYQKADGLPEKEVVSLATRRAREAGAIQVKFLKKLDFDLRTGIWKLLFQILLPKI